jgi:hypothetical protein
VNCGGPWVEERSAANDSILIGGRFGYRHRLDNGMRLTAGASCYDYLETQGQTPFWDGDDAGNRLTRPATSTTTTGCKRTSSSTTDRVLLTPGALTVATRGR